MSPSRLIIAVIVALGLGASSLASAGLDAKAGRPDIAYTEKDVSLKMSERSFNFMLDNLPLSVRLARELRITGLGVTRQGSEYLFTEPGFKFLLKSVSRGKLKRIVAFRYTLGLDVPIPIRTTGKGSAVLKTGSVSKKGIVTDITINLTMDDAVLDKISKKIPSMVKAIFSLKMEKFLRQAESLAEVMEGDPEYIMEIMKEDEERYTAAERKAFKKTFMWGHKA